MEGVIENGQVSEETKIDVGDTAMKRANLDQFELIGHSGPIYSLSMSFKKDLLISASFDTSIRLWDIDL